MELETPTSKTILTATNQSQNTIGSTVEKKILSTMTTQFLWKDPIFASYRSNRNILQIKVLIKNNELLILLGKISLKTPLKDQHNNPFSHPTFNTIPIISLTLLIRAWLQMRTIIWTLSPIKKIIAIIVSFKTKTTSLAYVKANNCNAVTITNQF